MTAEVGPWAKEKLEALERYLGFYTKVMKNQTQWRTIYIDAFAGGGVAQVRGRRREGDPTADLMLGIEPEAQEFIRGSPRVAMDLPDPFSTYVFIDADAARVATLEAIKTEPKYQDGRIVHVRAGKAADEIAWVLSHNLSPSRYRGVAFLDPFGAHLEWKTIEALAKSNVFEVFINVPLHMAINRLMKVDADIPATWRAQLDAFFPPGWWAEVYEDVDAGLFAGDTSIPAGIRKRRDAIDRLLRFYIAHLKNAFGYVSAPKLIRNTRQSPLYYLVWAGMHRRGLEGADYVLKMGERLPKGGLIT